ncbi:MAG: hypothetical protein KTR31_05910 [Myxococcales bacterium]|nr:hypothetical protein [Myxococcales bacterium]
MPPHSAWRTPTAALGLFALLHCGASEPATDVTIGLGAGSHEYTRPAAGCSSTAHRNTEIASFGSIRHRTASRLVLEGGVLISPAIDTDNADASPFQSAGTYALTGRIGADWRWAGFTLGPQLLVHPGLSDSVLPTPSVDLRLGPTLAYAWGRAFPMQSSAPVAGLLQAGFGTEGSLGMAEMGFQAPTARAGIVARGQMQLTPRWRLGAELLVHEAQRTFPGPDLRLLALVTFRAKGPPEPPWLPTPEATEDAPTPPTPTE